jgi:hypothetical protein
VSQSTNQFAPARGRALPAEGLGEDKRSGGLNWPAWCRRLAWCIILLTAPGCAWTQRVPGLAALTPAYRPQNVFVWSSSLPPQIRRVALMPMSCDEKEPELIEGKVALEPVLRTELAKAHRFEIIAVSPTVLRARTGQTVWACEQALPQEMFTWLSETCGCDAVLFSQLTVFRGYAPLAVGWRMRLVDLRTHSTVWATDEIFDAGLPAVRSGAYQYRFTGLQGGTGANDTWLIENSPRQFGQYAAAQLLATLPGL